MIHLKIFDETAPLEAVVLGTAESFGGTPKIEEANDPKSIEHIRAGTFPTEQALIAEIEVVDRVLKRYEVEVYRPDVMPNYNQIFSRDIGFVIGDRIVVPRIAKNRREEIRGIHYILDQVAPNKVLKPGAHERMEGGDVMPWNGKLFVGYSEQEDFDEYIAARTNRAGVEFLEKNFPDWEVCPFELRKSDSDPRENALHLDCCFQPVGKDQAILYPGGFKNPKDVDFLLGYFGEEKVIIIDREEMYNMNSNIVSLSPEVIISEKSFAHLNAELRKRGFIVEEVAYAETSKMEGLLRCSTLPLRRRYE